MSGAPGSRRRGLLAGLAAGALGLAGFRAGWFDPLLPERSPEFQPMPGLPAFRLIKSGALTLGSVPLFGLDREVPPELAAARLEVKRDICTALYGKSDIGGQVPVAYFFDFQCPVCRRLTPRLRQLEGIVINWHDLAGLGPASDVAARAAIAARAQGAGDVFHDRLMRARFQANVGYVTALAESVGIDTQKLLEDMRSAQVEQRMWLSRALAGQLGMAGTPGLVIGRTVIIGDQPDSVLKRIIEMERTDPGPCGLRG